MICKSFPARYPIVISGASKAVLNGVYKPTPEECDGKVAYEKHDGGMLIEYNTGWKKWLVRPTDFRDSNKSKAKSAVTDEKILSSNVTGWQDQSKNDGWANSSMVFYNCTITVK